MGTGTWWGRAVAASASVAVVAGTVAAVAGAAGADREAERVRALAVTTGPASDDASAGGPVVAGEVTVPAGTLVPGPPPGRAGDPDLAATVELLPGWVSADGQDLVPVTPERFPTVVTLADRAAVLVGRLDLEGGFGPDTLADEADRLVTAFSDGVRAREPAPDEPAPDESASDESAPEGEAAPAGIEDVAESPDDVAGRDAFTTVRRVTDEAGDVSIVRVTTVAPAGEAPGLVLLGVAGPGPDQDADADAADRVVRSLAGEVPPPGAPAPLSPPEEPTGR